ncbi:hypothetical protein BDY21DRAFT_204265 [Lineolata rhizophorae]|uniref:U4/U6 snRNA-associated-splicing factor PRP24 n=1 Tax=Lineolata rhizophorae TaxID=578093 RepID=A0A6A6P3X0_9PEZI|nr:hypothetical protein BDY21DRAFT_204265 [Lineolata rhizophorae]
MQNRHPPAPSRHNSRGLLEPTYESQRSPSLGYNIHSLPRSLSARSAHDIAMSEAPKEPRVFSTRSLSHEDCDAVAELAKHLDKNPSDYNSHLQFIELLHKGFVAHLFPADESQDAPPQSYELLEDLRQARAVMDARFAVGEEQWLKWVDDESAAAANTTERVGVMELFGRAIADEPTSVPLWKAYGTFMEGMWAAANGLSEVSPAAVKAAEKWSEEDMLIAKEVFTQEQAMGIWEHAAGATQWRINDSHEVWNHYVGLLVDDARRMPARERDAKVQHIKAMFHNRLMQPHAEWGATSSLFSTFLSEFDNASWEETMKLVTQRAEQAKQAYSLRDTHEFRIARAQSAGDRDAEWAAYKEYLEWELKLFGVFSFNLANAVFERATIRFPTDSNLWLEYIEFLIQKPQKSSAPDAPILQVLERATRHCPWSGDLWSHRLLALESEGKDFVEIEGMKHKATETGLLDVGGMEELTKFYIAWCGFLRRRALEEGAEEDDLDIAEVGIRSALEHVRALGEKRYGKDYTGDPQYRLERIHIKFFMQSGKPEEARRIYEGLIPHQHDSYDFWYRRYIFEMVVFSNDQLRRANAHDDAMAEAEQRGTPARATAVLRQALEYVNTMNWPEQLVQMFLNHCEQHETVQGLRLGMIEARRAGAQVLKRREKEASEAAAAAAAQQAQYPQPADAAVAEDVGAEMEEPLTNGKRKRDSEATDLTGNTPKKSKAEDQKATGGVPGSAEESHSTSAQVKRNRENSTIIVRNIPEDATETRVRQFFRDCGKVVSLKLLPDEHPDADTLPGSQVATIEFESHEDALFAQARDGRSFDGKSNIHVSIGTNTTLWVTNYPPTADENYIRKLFAPYGDIISIRFPSLAYNTHRRFCYVQFLTTQSARAAEAALDGADVDGFKLVAKISNPGKKQERHGATAEGREIYVGNLHWDATGKELRDLFSRFGDIERVNVPRNLKGRGKGAGFVAFARRIDAEHAAGEMDGETFMGRRLSVKVAATQAGKAGPKGAKAVVIRPSVEPEDGGGGSELNGGGRRGSTVSDAASTPAPAAAGSDAAETRRPQERTIALLDVPDTVNDARIRAAVEALLGEAEAAAGLRKIVMRPDRGGVLVEFERVADAGRVAMKAEAEGGVDFGVEGGRKARVGRPEELMKEGRREVRSDKLGGGPGKKEKAEKERGAEAARKGSFAPAPVSRPRQAAPRGRPGRGGLGLKRGFGASGGASGSGAGPAKSNADFRAMFLKGKEGAEKDEEGDERMEEGVEGDEEMEV